MVYLIIYVSFFEKSCSNVSIIYETRV